MEVSGLITQTGKAATFTPQEEGTYIIRVCAKDEFASKYSKYSKLKYLKVAAKSDLKNTSTVDKTAAYVNSEVQVKGSATGGTGNYTYEFYYKKDGAKSWSKFGANGETDTQTATLKPGSVGTYFIRTYAKARNDINEEVASSSKDFIIIVKEPAIENTSTVSQTTISVGETVEVKGSATGDKGDGTYYTYAFYSKKRGESGWSEFGANGETDTTTATFEPTSAGTYTVRTFAYFKNKNGSTAAKSFKDFTITVKKPAIVNTSTVSQTTISVGETVLVQGSATGSTGNYTYKFYYKKDGAKSWSKFGDKYITDTTATFKSSSAGTYIIRTYAKAQNDNNEEAASNAKDFTITVNPAAFENNSTVTDTTIPADAKVKITGSAIGGEAPYKYKFFYKKVNAESEWTEFDADPDHDNQGKWTPEAVGIYILKSEVSYEKVSETGSETISKDKSFIITVKPALINTSTVSEQEIIVGSTVAVTCSSTGGVGDRKYEFKYYKYEEGKEYQEIEDASNLTEETETTALFTPKEEGFYWVEVWARDELYPKYESFCKSKKFRIVVKPVIEITSLEFIKGVTDVIINDRKITETTVGTEVKIKGSAKGGFGNYTYNFYYKRDNESDWKSFVSSSLRGEASFKPTTIGTYNIKVRVTDSKGNFVEKTLDNITVCAALKNTSGPVKSGYYKDDKNPGWFTVGEGVTINTSAADGILQKGSYYTFKCEYKKNGESNWIDVKCEKQDNAWIAQFRPAVGTYTVQVDVQDDANNTSRKTFEVIVEDPLINTTTSKTENGEIIITGSATGGSGDYTYEFKYKKQADPDDEKYWSKFGNNYRTDTTATLKPSTTDIYTVRTYVSDGISEAVMDLDVSVNLVNKSTLISDVATVTKDKKFELKQENSKSAIVMSNKTVKINISAVGGDTNASYVYKISYKSNPQDTAQDTNSLTWVIPQDLSETHTNNDWLELGSTNSQDVQVILTDKQKASGNQTYTYTVYLKDKASPDNEAVGEELTVEVVDKIEVEVSGKTTKPSANSIFFEVTDGNNSKFFEVTNVKGGKSNANYVYILRYTDGAKDLNGREIVKDFDAILSSNSNTPTSATLEVNSKTEYSVFVDAIDTKNNIYGASSSISVNFD